MSVHNAKRSNLCNCCLSRRRRAAGRWRRRRCDCNNAPVRMKVEMIIISKSQFSLIMLRTEMSIVCVYESSTWQRIKSNTNSRHSFMNGLASTALQILRLPGQFQKFTSHSLHEKNLLSFLINIMYVNVLQNMQLNSSVQFKNVLIL